MDKLRPSLVGRLDVYKARAIAGGRGDVAAKFEAMRHEFELIESATNLSCAAAQLADYLIFEATRSRADIDPSAFDEAIDLAHRLDWHAAAITDLIDSGSSFAADGAEATLKLIGDAANGLSLALDIAQDRFDHDIDGAANIDVTDIAIEFDERRAVTVAQVAAIRWALILCLHNYRQRVLNGGRCRRRGPPRCTRTSTHLRCVPLGSNAPPAQHALGGCSGSRVIRGR